MKHLLLTTIAAVVLVGCGESQQSAPAPEAKPEPPTAKAPDISLLNAAEDGNIEAVKQHLDAGADVNAKNKVGQTPLHLAVANDHKEIIELLIAKDADLNAKDVWEGTPLYEAASKAHKEIAELLIANGADVNANIYGWTPLHSAARDGHKEIAELFITEGADVNAKDQDANTPLDRAKFFPNRKSMKRHSETANLLRQHGGKTGAELKAEGK